MDNVQVCWVIVAGLVTAVWGFITCIRSWKSQGIELATKVMNDLFEMDKTIIEHPDIQMYLSQNAHQQPEYFRNEKVLQDVLFFKAKAAAYKDMNMFDAILCISSLTGKKFTIFSPSFLIELSDWQAYIKMKLGHPLYRSIIDNEKEIFGQSLRDFWDTHEKEIISRQVDPFMW